MSESRCEPNAGRPAAAASAARLELIRRVSASQFLSRRAAFFSPPATAVSVSGLWGSAGALLVAALAGSLRRSALIICPGAEEAEKFEEDLAGFSPLAACGFPAWDLLPGEAEEPDSETLAARLGALEALRSAAAEGALVVAPAAALMQGVPRPEALLGAARELRPGQPVERGELMSWLARNGYRRVAAAEAAGEFAVRGGIVDVFPLFGRWAARVELAEERIESLRELDPGSGRSTGRRLGELRLAAFDRAGAFAGAGASLLDHLPGGALLVVVEPEAVAEHARLYATSFSDRPGKRAPSAERLLERLSARAPRLELRRVGAGAADELDFGAGSLERLRAGGADEAAAALGRLAAERERVLVFSETVAERERLEALLAERLGPARPAGLELVVGRLAGGFDWPAEGLAAVSERELLGRYGRMRRASARPAAPATPIESLADLAPGEYVVHRTHGIGRYLGLEVLSAGGRREEHLCIQYADDARLYVPAGALDLVARYLAPGGAPPELSRLGSRRWAERSRRVQAAARDIAADLLRLAAARAALPGVSLPPEDDWNRAFAAGFPYEDTPDQAAAWAAIRADLEAPRPADRLLCGDVGFGKTEIAVRAAFKAASAGRQTAVMVPTTLLAEQHGRTFRERMADYPVRAEVLSRFRSAAEQARILAEAADGRVDVLIGTHRLLGADVAFRDLGLVIIDEEQRFGVEHKEKLKRLRAAVNVLTLTATPIPRTLHLAMLGLRDVSALGTPPAGRLAVRTRAARWNDDLIRRAVLRELARGGQVYFVHNRVESIGRVAARLEKLVPEARLAVAHGQMAESELEAAMAAFLERRADLLVSTVIIESGLDIPSVNTIFIDRADRFGLADLHQLRGRVGRWHERAWCYLLIPPEESISAEALARVKALEEFSELGAGWRLAMRDLELRGAGNILGAEQSGHIAEVGYDFYARALARAAAELGAATGAAASRPAPPAEDWEVSISLAGAALLPESCVPEAGERLEIYHRLAGCRSDAGISELAEELADRYGRLPPEAGRLLGEARLRARARAARVAFVGLAEHRLALRFFKRRSSAAREALAGEKDVRVLDDESITLALPPEAERDEAALFAAVEAALERLAVASA